MALKKSDLYSSIWASCDALRGGMDASQYKDYVLFLLFIKYITDKYGDSDDFEPPVTSPAGASFTDMIAMKGKPDIGDRINKEVIAPLVAANSRLARSDFPDFNDPNKLGEGKEMVDRLTSLVAIFQKPELASVLSDMDAELAALEQRREKTRALKQGMMQELLTGRTRLV
jgi:type I restriction enzyme M protein